MLKKKIVLLIFLLKQLKTTHKYYNHAFILQKLLHSFTVKYKSSGQVKIEYNENLYSLRGKIY